MTGNTLPRLLRRAVAEIVVENELVRLLEQGRPLRIKQGFDPSRPDLHLGHAVCLRKLRQFQELGHEVILVVGDWTARIGDPSGRAAPRVMLTPEEVQANARTYMEQFFRVVNRERTRAVYQSEWYDRFTLADVIYLSSKFTVARMLAREDFASRFEQERPIGLVELLYPLLQAYDSVAVQADVEVGGTDQRFNILLGRDLQAAVGQVPQQAFLVPLLLGTDGAQKMSKALGNHIGIAEPPGDMYGKLMSIPDQLIPQYYELLTDMPDEELEEIKQSLATRIAHPMDLKKRMAYEIVAQFHSPDAAREAALEFERVFQRREVPSEVSEVGLGPEWFGRQVHAADLVLAAGLASSRSEARRLVLGGGVRLNGERIGEAPVMVHEGALLQVGRRRFVRLVRRDGGAQ